MPSSCYLAQTPACHVDLHQAFPYDCPEGLNTALKYRLYSRMNHPTGNHQYITGNWCCLLAAGFSTSTSEQDGTNNDIRIGSPDSIDEIAPGTPNRPHKSSKEADLAFNHSLISALAQQLADGTSEALSQTEQLILAASDFPMARYTLLLAFVQACHISKAPAVPAKALLRIVRAMWPEVQTSGPASGAVFQPVVDEEGHLLAGHLKALNKKPAKAHAALLQHALLVALQTMPASDIQAATGDLVSLHRTLLLRPCCHHSSCGVLLFAHKCQTGAMHHELLSSISGMVQWILQEEGTSQRRA